MQFDGIWFFSIILYIVSFLGVVFSSVFLTKEFDDIKFSFMSVFPFEVLRHTNEHTSIYKSSMFLFAGMSFSPLFLISKGLGMFENFKPISIICCISFAVCGLLFVFLNLFDATHTRVHIYLFTGFLSFSLLGNVLAVIRGMNIYKILIEHSLDSSYVVIFSAIAVLSILFLIFILLNPNLKNWANLEKIEGSDNKYIRPKRFPLVYSEWGILLATFVGEISLFLQLLIK